MSVVEIREERKEYKRAKAGEQGQHAPAAKKAPAPKKAPAAKKTAPKKAPAKKTAKKTAAKKSAVERGVDGGGMASKPGAKELDIFSGDSEEEEKKAVEALTQMLRDDPLAYQQTLDIGNQQPVSRNAAPCDAPAPANIKFRPITEAERASKMPPLRRSDRKRDDNRFKPY
jgi:hypothetical protein